METFYIFPDGLRGSNLRINRRDPVNLSLLSRDSTSLRLSLLESRVKVSERSVYVMPRRRQVSDSPSEQEEFKSQLTGTSPEAIENEMIALAVKEVEYRIRNHTASSMELVHYLKMGSEKERLEREKLAAEVELQRVKAEAIEAAKSSEELYSQAIEAMKLYAGVEGE